MGLVDRGVLDVPIIGVAKSGWGLDQFRDYATASLRLNNTDPTLPPATKMLGLLRYVDGDLADPATYDAMSKEVGGRTSPVLPRGSSACPVTPGTIRLADTAPEPVGRGSLSGAAHNPSEGGLLAVSTRLQQ